MSGIRWLQDDASRRIYMQFLTQRDQLFTLEVVIATRCGVWRVACRSCDSPPPHLELEVNADVPTGQVANPPRGAVVETRVNTPAGTTSGFFDRRVSVITRAFGSPKTPRRRACGRKPGNRYVSSRPLDLVEVGIEQSCQISVSRQTRQTQYRCGFQPCTTS